MADIQSGRNRFFWTGYREGVEPMRRRVDRDILAGRQLFLAEAVYHGNVLSSRDIARLGINHAHWSGMVQEARGLSEHMEGST